MGWTKPCYEELIHQATQRGQVIHFFFLVFLFFVYFLASLSLIQWWLFLSSVFLFFVFVSVCHSRHLNNQNLKSPGWNLWYEIEETFLFYIFLFLERISFFLCLWQLPLVSLSLCLFASLFITHSIKINQNLRIHGWLWKYFDIKNRKYFVSGKNVLLSLPLTVSSRSIPYVSVSIVAK